MNLCGGPFPPLKNDYFLEISTYVSQNFELSRGFELALPVGDPREWRHFLVTRKLKPSDRNATAKLPVLHPVMNAQIAEIMKMKSLCY